MTRTSDIFTSACGLAVALVLCACTAGCDRAPEKAAPAPVAVQPAASSSDEAAYQAQLQGTMADRKKKLEMLARVNARLRAMEDRARRVAVQCHAEAGAGQDRGGSAGGPRVPRIGACARGKSGGGEGFFKGAGTDPRPSHAT